MKPKVRLVAVKNIPAGTYPIASTYDSRTDKEEWYMNLPVEAGTLTRLMTVTDAKMWMKKAKGYYIIEEKA